MTKIKYLYAYRIYSTKQKYLSIHGKTNFAMWIKRNEIKRFGSWKNNMKIYINTPTNLCILNLEHQRINEW